MIVPTNAQTADATLTTKSITANGTYNASSDGADGYSSVEVDVYNPFEYQKSVPSFTNLTFPSGTEIRLRNLTVINSPNFLYRVSCPLLKLKIDNPPTNLRYFLYYIKAEKIILDVDTSQVSDFGFFLYYANISEIVGDIDFTSATNIAGFNINASTSFYGRWKMTFVPNTLRLSTNGSITGGVDTFTDNTKISFANALNESVTGKTVYRPIVNNSNLIIGNSIYDSEHGYHLFVADENGEMTLQDFITNVKGWTLT